MEWFFGILGFIIVCAICNNHHNDDDNSGTHADISNDDIEYDYLQRQQDE